jgi:hypothetical protein
METLRNIPEDGTYRQDKAAQTVKEWTLQGHQPWCFDLTSATDLFPVVIQFIVMNGLYPEISREWYSLIRNARTYDSTRNIWYNFEVGQPMGLYSSWAAFSISHHILIRFAFASVGLDFRGRYYIIGDDVAILDSKAAVKYEELILGLGVPISKSKSITPYLKVSGSLPSAEIAKRYFVNGKELTPVRPYELESLSGAGWPLALEFFQKLIHRWGHEDMNQILSIGPVALESPFLMWVDKIHRKKLLLIALSPHSPALLTGVRPDWWPSDKSLYFLEAAGFVTSEKMAILVENMFYVFNNRKAILRSDTQPDDHQYLNHPVHKSLVLLEEDLKAISRAVADGVVNYSMIYGLGLNLELMVSMTKDNKTFKDYKSLQVKRSQATAEYTLDVWAQLINEIGYKPKDEGWPRVKSTMIQEDDWCYGY